MIFPPTVMPLLKGKAVSSGTYLPILLLVTSYLTLLQIKFTFTSSERQLQMPSVVKELCAFLWPLIQQLLLRLPQPRSKDVCCASPSHFLHSALCLWLGSRNAWLLNTISGYILFTGCRKTLVIVFPLGVLLHKIKCVSTRQACSEAITGRSARTLCKYL